MRVSNTTSMPGIHSPQQSWRGKRLSINVAQRDGPTDPTPYPQIEFGTLSDELDHVGPTPRAKNTQNAEVKAPHASVTVGDAITSHAPHRKFESFEETERRNGRLIPLHKLRQGGFVNDCLMYRQIFPLRSYEVGMEKKLLIGTIFSFLQVSA